MSGIEPGLAAFLVDHKMALDRLDNGEEPLAVVATLYEGYGSYSQQRTVASQAARRELATPAKIQFPRHRNQIRESCFTIALCHIC